VEGEFDHLLQETFNFTENVKITKLEGACVLLDSHDKFLLFFPPRQGNKQTSNAIRGAENFHTNIHVNERFSPPIYQ